MPRMHGFSVSVIEGKDVFKDSSGYLHITTALPNAFAILNISNDRDSNQQTKVAMKGSNPKFSETFFL